MRLRLDIDDLTYHALSEHAAAELRPIPWQAEMILRRYLGTEREPQNLEAIEENMNEIKAIVRRELHPNHVGDHAGIGDPE